MLNGEFARQSRAVFARQTFTRCFDPSRLQSQDHRYLTRLAYVSGDLEPITIGKLTINDDPVEPVRCFKCEIISHRTGNKNSVTFDIKDLDE